PNTKPIAIRVTHCIGEAGIPDAFITKSDVAKERDSVEPIRQFTRFFPLFRCCLDGLFFLLPRLLYRLLILFLTEDTFLTENIENALRVCRRSQEGYAQQEQHCGP